MEFFSIYTRFDKLVIAFIISINLLSFIFYGVDKLKAKKHSWRIPELNLLLLGLFGGGVGSLIGMVVFHHKLAKKKFIISVPFLVLINFISFLYLYPRLKGLI